MLPAVGNNGGGGGGMLMGGSGGGGGASTVANNNKKNKKNQRVLLWLFAIVIVVVIVIFFEDETELRHADDLATTSKSSRRQPFNNDRDTVNGVGDVEGGDLGAIYGLPHSSTKTTEGQLPSGTTTPSHQQHNNKKEFSLTTTATQKQQSRYDKRNRDTETITNKKMNRMDDDLFTYFRNSRSQKDHNNDVDLRLKKKAKSQTVTTPLANHKKKKRQDKKKDRTELSPDNTKKKLQPFPVIRYDDDNIPRGAHGSVIHAADALLCRESVIDYVINATDLKDECDGLKKAFTKTCADDQDSGPVPGGGSIVQSASGYSSPLHDDESETQKDGRARSQRQRRLTKNGIDVPFSAANNPVIEWQYRLHRLTRFIRSQTSRLLYRTATTTKKDLLMAEDEVLEEWDDALEEVRRGWDWRNRDREIQFILDWVVNEDSEDAYDQQIPAASNLTFYTVGSSKPPQQVHQRNLREESMATNGRNKRSDSMENDAPSLSILSQKDKVATNSTTSANSPQAKDVPKDVNKHLANLALPTTMKHVSEKLLSETLMLQQEHKYMKAVHNQTNHTVSDAQADAMASVKAVSDANDLVSSVFNDPTSVEARTCCTSILNVFHENCNYEPEEELSDSRLFVAILIIAVCGLVKSLIRHFSIRWLPEAAGCILVGVSAGYLLTFYPHHDISFDGKWFLRIMVPPIVFEAALSIDKRSFNRHVMPILFYAIVGTLLSSGVTAVVLHEGSTFFRGRCETIPYPEALTFGALISSIDPIAVLSVLSNMGMSDVDTIYVVIFGESLLNDGVAIVLFQTLVHFLDDNMEVDSHAITAAAIHFLVVFIGSFLIGIGSGLCCTVYYWAMHGCQTPLVEVLMFCCWALFPYYVCDGIEWSGIVSVVAAGFVMDIFVVGTHFGHESLFERDSSCNGSDLGMNDSVPELSEKLPKDRRRRKNVVRRPIFSRDGHLSTEAKTHIGFVTEIIATMMETAIFAYLGLFLFSSRYHWNFYHVFIAISGCCISRAVMIPSLSLVANWITTVQQVQDRRRQHYLDQSTETHQHHTLEIRKAPGVIIDRKMQLVLWFAGLRGAMSFALVEDIPLYDAVTGEGTRLKSELKAMTSASIMFTVFVLGGATFYMMEYLGLAPTQQRKDSDMNSPSMLEREMEMIGLLSRSQSSSLYEKNEDSGEDSPPLTSPTQNLSDEDEFSHDVYSAGSHSTYDSRTGSTPRMVSRPGTFRRQRQTQQKH